ncbi:hypothetical protein [Shewanella sp. Isolate11]|uniref:hypothetical protein n=1 Tax=Shewanella sp. Isolate11 TaxID=2908530 RepID=UPI001EFCE3CC|nr:hypothetical protein [Shewanella sp. Isolate11]MCG9696680.1 hypothetical protein [Shewanella sp. Isolate11]
MLTRTTICRLGSLWLISGLFLLSGCFNQESNQKVTSKLESQSQFEIDDSLCQFKQSECKQTIADLLISLTISPENTPSEKPLQIDLDFSKPVENLSGRIEGRDMFMGIIPVNLSQTSENHYQATTVYGSCSSNYMVWRLLVSFIYQGQPRTVIFDFLADNPN